MRRDYFKSGLSTLDAVGNFHDSLPRWERPLARFMRMSMACDGQRCSAIGRTSGKLENGIWSKSNGWTHRADLDFCPQCQEDGRMEQAIRDGVLPLGACSD